MATAYKVLGQTQPSASALTTAYTVPASSSAVVGTITCCNMADYPTQVRIAVRVAGAAISNKAYVYYDTTVLGMDTVSMQLGITMAATDVLSVQSVNGLVSFNVFGTEMSA